MDRIADTWWSAVFGEMNSRAATGWNGDNANRAKNPALAMVGRRAAFEALADFG